MIKSLKDSTTSLQGKFKQSMQRYVPELRDKEYDARMHEVLCDFCGKAAQRAEYKIQGESDWKPAAPDMDIECSECSGRRVFEEQAKESSMTVREYLLKRFEEQYWEVPQDLEQAGFKKYDVSQGETLLLAQQAAMKYVQDFSNSPPEQRYNLLFMGPTGTGKTFLSTAIARNLKHRGALVGFMTVGSLMTKIKATYSKGAAQTEKGILDDISKMECLVLDDLGIGAGSEWSEDMLFEVIERRKGKPTIYSTNNSEEELPKAIGARQFSRINYNTKFIELVGEDYRKKFRIT